MNELHDIESVPLKHLSRTSLSSGASDLSRLLSEDDDDNSSSSSLSEPKLPPVDRGRGAWTCLIGCWLVEAVVWGFPLAFGIWESHYSEHPLFHDSLNIPTIGTLATGVTFLSAPLTIYVLIRWPQYRNAFSAVGFVMCLAALLLASFSNQVWQLMLTQGLLYGSGWSICGSPFLFAINDWWVERRGLAYGILFGASGVSGLIIPVGVDWLLQRYDFRVALRVYALVILVIGGPAFLLIKPRLGTSTRTPDAPKKASRSLFGTLLLFTKDVNFYLFIFAIFLQGLSFFIPRIYIPSFATDLGLPNSTRDLLLGLISLAQMFGQLWQGWISDKVNIYIPVSLSALIPGIAALALWGPAKGLARLAPFAIIWGFFSASYTVLFTRICTFLASTQSSASLGSVDSEEMTMLLYGFFSFERGVSAALEGPISSWLIGGTREDSAVNLSEWALGRYTAMVWFTAICMLASGASGVGYFWTFRRRKG